jgi:hypothetical protein
MRDSYLRITTSGLLLMLGAWPSAAQEQVRPEIARRAPAPRVEEQGRLLGGHLFIPSELVVDPFVETNFRSVTGAAYLRSDAPVISLTGEEQAGRQSFTQAGYSQRFELQLKLLPFLAIRGNASALVYSGVTGRSFLTLGSAVQYAAGGGVTIGQRFGQLQVALVGDAAFEPTYSVNVGTAIAASLRAGRVDTGALVIQQRSVPLRAGASAAWAPLPALGLQLMGRYEHAFREQSPLQSRDALVGAAAADLDFLSFTPLPLGLLIAYQITAPFGESDRTDLSHYFDGGLFYTGRRDLVLGIEGSVRRFPQRARVDSDAVLASVVVRYYW